MNSLALFMTLVFSVLSDLGITGFDIVFFIILIIIGLIIVLLIRVFLVLIPAVLIAIVVWLLTGDLFWAGIAFLVVAALSFLARL
jgi:hypothetical protein